MWQARTVQQGAKVFSQGVYEVGGSTVTKAKVKADSREEQDVYSSPHVTELLVKTAQPRANVFGNDDYESGGGEVKEQGMCGS